MLCKPLNTNSMQNLPERCKSSFTRRARCGAKRSGFSGTNARGLESKSVARIFGWKEGCVSRPLVPFAAFVLVSVFPAIAGAQQTAPPVATSQYDNARTGATLSETTLTPENVNVKKFGKLGAYKVDGAVYAQPLYVPGVAIAGKGTRNVIFVAIEHDSVYAFDADKPGDAPLWHVSFLDPQNNVTTVTAQQVGCPFIAPEVGITSTPVIDMETGTLYVLARTAVTHTLSRTDYFQNLHALAITTGVEKFGGPKPITASAKGKGDDSQNGVISFNNLRENPRAALLLTNGVLYLTWASSCDVDPYHGWVIAYDPETLAQKAVLNVTPDGSEGGIWMSDAGPAADAAGNIYVPIGNGTFNANANGGRDWGDSIVKLALDGSSFTVRDSFTPFNQEQLSRRDADLGSSGPTLIPDQPGKPAHILIQPGKSGDIYVINRDKMGGYGQNSDAILQKFKMRGGCYTAIAYWNSHVYIACEDDRIRSYNLVKGQLLETPAVSTTHFDNPGATPAISANGAKDGILWAIATKTWNGPQQSAVLYAFDAAKMGDPLYTSEQNAARDRAADATRFVIPLVANRRVYFGARGEVEIYGLLK
jgi:hypothetical protein